MNSKNKHKLSAISTFHIFRLIFRSALFLTGVVCYTVRAVVGEYDVLSELLLSRWFIITVWIIFAAEMVMRFFPSSMESPGCQKQFARNYHKTGNVDVQFLDNNATVLVALLWVILNGIVGAMKMMGWLNDSIMLLLCLFYSVCDMICILFFCPFQTWFLKNKCCATCRIYNWDYAMMFTPLFFVKQWYAWSLLLLSIVLVLRWEIAIFRYPERFSERTNGYLGCQNCTEKLCVHKKQLHALWVDISDFTKNRIEYLKK